MGKKHTESERRDEEKNSKLWNEDKVEQLKMFECAMDTTPQLLTLICAAVIVGQLLDPKIPDESSIMDYNGEYILAYKKNCSNLGIVTTSEPFFEQLNPNENVRGAD